MFFLKFNIQSDDDAKGPVPSHVSPGRWESLVRASRIVGIAVVVGLIGLSHASTVEANQVPATSAVTPLLLKGKTSLYQRVLSRPKATLVSEPGAQADQDAEELGAFSVFYVYERRTVDGQEWLKLGTDTRGGIAGWMPAAQSLAWNQALTVAFREPLGHDRVMMFKDRDSLMSLVQDYDLAAYRQLYKQALSKSDSAGQVAVDESPVVAVQPKTHLDIHNDFYLVPIKQHEDVFLENEQALMLNIASVPLDPNEIAAQGSERQSSEDKAAEGEGEASPGETMVLRIQDARGQADANHPFKSGIVFVIDTTTSMGPYIEQTRQVVRDVYGAIQDAGLTNQVSFGLVGYRDTLELRPGLEYVSRVFADLKQGQNPEAFFKQVRQAVPATVSSRGFIEDAFAGVKRAVEDMDWTGYQGRFVVLVTDAGPRLSSDPLSSTGLSAKGLNQLARDQNIHLMTMHLKTPQGLGNHASAARAYRQLSLSLEDKDLYYGVPAGDVGRFGRAISRLSGDITRLVANVTRDIPVAAVPPEREDQSELRKLRTRVAKIGHALRLRYLAAQKGETAPDIFDAWMLDHYYMEPETQSVDVRLLLTRDQLSDLTAVLQRVLQTAEDGLLAPDTFLDELKSLAASISRDPASVAGSTRATGGGVGNLADLGYMREYIEGLPYTGEVMNVTLDDWENWSAKDQLAFINSLEDKISYYKALHDHTDLWIALDGGPVTGDAVFPVVLGMLP